MTEYYHEKFMPTLTTKNIWKLGLLAEEKVIKKDNLELRYLIINKFGDINMGYKFRVCPFEDGNQAKVEIHCIENDMKPNINIGKRRLDAIPSDDKDDCMVECKYNKCKLWKLINKV